MPVIYCSNNSCDFCKRDKQKIFVCTADEVNIDSSAACVSATEVGNFDEEFKEESD